MVPVFPIYSVFKAIIPLEIYFIFIFSASKATYILSVLQKKDNLDEIWIGLKSECVFSRVAWPFDVFSYVIPFSLFDLKLLAISHCSSTV